MKINCAREIALRFRSATHTHMHSHTRTYTHPHMPILMFLYTHAVFVNSWNSLPGDTFVTTLAQRTQNGWHLSKSSPLFSWESFLLFHYFSFLMFWGQLTLSRLFTYYLWPSELPKWWFQNSILQDVGLWRLDKHNMSQMRFSHSEGCGLLSPLSHRHKHPHGWTSPSSNSLWGFQREINTLLANNA